METETEVYIDGDEEEEQTETELGIDATEEEEQTGTESADGVCSDASAQAQCTTDKDGNACAWDGTICGTCGDLECVDLVYSGAVVSAAGCQSGYCICACPTDQECGTSTEGQEPDFSMANQPCGGQPETTVMYIDGDEEEEQTETETEVYIDGDEEEEQPETETEVEEIKKPFSSGAYKSPG